MEIERKPITDAEIKAKEDKIKSEREKLEHRLEVEKLENNHGAVVGILALIIVILLGILLGTE
jgi:hypothetical protein